MPCYNLTCVKHTAVLCMCNEMFYSWQKPQIAGGGTVPTYPHLLTPPHRRNSTAAPLWPCPHHGHPGLPDGGAVCLPAAQAGPGWVGAHAVPPGSRPSQVS